MNPRFLALVSEPAPAGRSSAAGIAIILLCLAAAVAFAVRAAVRRFKAGGGCCGGSPSGPGDDGGKRIGSPVFALEMGISGMHCMKCAERVKKALEAVPGVGAEVDLQLRRALVRADRRVPGETLRAAVEEQGFSVTSMS